jgi:quinol-cytochrome oxidoreductase complex cytochrome b subunit
MDLLPQSLLIVLMQFISFGVLAYSVHFLHRYTRMTATDARSATLIGTISILYGIWLVNMGTTDPNTSSLNFVFPMFPTIIGFTLTILPFSLGVALIILGYSRYTVTRKSEPGLRLQSTENV